jgi:hypothetical protein
VAAALIPRRAAYAAVKAITLMGILTPILRLVNELTGGYLSRRRVQLRVHTGVRQERQPNPVLLPERDEHVQ